MAVDNVLNAAVSLPLGQQRGDFFIARRMLARHADRLIDGAEVVRQHAKARLLARRALKRLANAGRHIPFSFQKRVDSRL